MERQLSAKRAAVGKEQPCSRLRDHRAPGRANAIRSASMNRPSTRCAPIVSRYSGLDVDDVDTRRGLSQAVRRSTCSSRCSRSAAHPSTRRASTPGSRRTRANTSSKNAPAAGSLYRARRQRQARDQQMLWAKSEVERRHPPEVRATMPAPVISISAVASCPTTSTRRIHRWRTSPCRTRAAVRQGFDEASPPRRHAPGPGQRECRSPPRREA